MNVLRAMLRFATSTEIAIGLMAFLALLSLVGATVPQGETGTYYVKTYGGFFGGLFWHLGLGDVFHSTYYTVLLVLLCATVIACSLKGLPQKVRAARPRHFISDEDAISRMASSAKIVLGLEDEEAQLHIVDICRKHFYKVQSRIEGDVRSLIASKMGLWRYGSLALHLSFIFLLAGGIAITRLSSRAYETVRVGDAFDLQVSADQVLKVKVEDFDIEFDDRDNISDFICDVAILGEGGVLRRATIRPNHPLKYGSKEIYLMSYEQDETTTEGFVTSVYDSSGALVIPHLYIPITEAVYVEELKATVQATGDGAPKVRLLFDDGRVESRTIRGSGAADPRAGYQLVMMHPVPSLMVTLEVVKEPGQWLIVAGLALLTLGVFTSLYLSHRIIWFVVKPHQAGKAQVVFGGRASRNRDGFAREFEAIRRTLEELA